MVQNDNTGRLEEVAQQRLQIYQAQLFDPFTVCAIFKCQRTFQFHICEPVGLEIHGAHFAYVLNRPVIGFLELTIERGRVGIGEVKRMA